MTSTLSYSSGQNSRSTDTLRTMTGTSHDDVFTPTSTNNSITTNTNRVSLHYLPQIIQTLPDERPEYRQRLATTIKDMKEQHVTDFLRIIKYLNGTYHLEEIASLENATRLQISTIIEKVQSIVIRALHPDPNPILQI